MSRDRSEGTRHASKNQRRQRDAGPAADERDDDRRHSGAKSQRAFGARDDEARRQIRELRSRY